MSQMCAKRNRLGEEKMDELDDAKRDLTNATIDFENEKTGWRAYTSQLNAKLDGTELQIVFLRSK